MNFKESEQYLLSLGNEVSTMKLGLESISRLLAALGNPQDNFLKVQVAGTNGKGSVCAFLNAICVSAGIETGMFTSPHLISITERVQINGTPTSETEFAKYATQVRRTAESLVEDSELESVPTFFEQVTAIALLAFADLKVDLAILETGLGGRLDATTGAKAEIAVITRIDLDHQQYLGETIEKIAAEKAAVIRASTKLVIVGEQIPTVEKIVLDKCAEFTLVPRLASQLNTWNTSTGVIFESFGKANLGLEGDHQIQNAKLAIITAVVLGESFPISVDTILFGLESARHPGRLEFRGRYLFDGAHNVGGAKALSAYLDKFVDKAITMIFGTMREKDVREIGEILFPKADLLILTEPKNTRALSATEIASSVPGDLHPSRIILTTSTSEALTIAVELSPPGNLILVTGSLYLVGEALSQLRITSDEI